MQRAQRIEWAQGARVAIEAHIDSQCAALAGRVDAGSQRVRSVGEGPRRVLLTGLEAAQGRRVRSGVRELRPATGRRRGDIIGRSGDSAGTGGLAGQSQVEFFPCLPESLPPSARSAGSSREKADCAWLSTRGTWV